MMEANGGGKNKQGREAGVGGVGGDGGGGGEEGEQRSTTRIKWTPDEESLEVLLGMGIDRNSAIKGLYYTGNNSAEFAAAYIFDHPDLDEDIDFSMRFFLDGPKLERSRGARAVASQELDEPHHYRMVFVVNSSLNMTPGRVAAEVGHASVGLYRHLNNGGNRLANQLAIWEVDGERMSVVYGDDDAYLNQIERQAASADLETYIVRGVEGEEINQNMMTVVGIFGREDLVNSLVDELL